MTSPIDGRVEMFYSGAWNAVTSDIDGGTVDVSYGQADEHSGANPTTGSLILDNSTNGYAPEDPTSALYQQVGVGTPTRIRVGPPQVQGVVVPGDKLFTAIYTPDVAALDITGDIDIRIDVTSATWRPSVAVGLARKYVTTGDQRSWALSLATTGHLVLRWTTAGTSGSFIEKTSTVMIPQATTRLAVRVVLDVNNGASGNDVKFYTAPDINGVWTQLGATVTTAGTTSIFSSSANVEVGRADPLGISSIALTGIVHAFELRNGIAGTQVANPIFTAQEPGTKTFTDAATRVWTIESNVAAITDPSLRAWLRAGAWSPGWDSTAIRSTVSVEAAGILRRLGQGDEPIRSSMYRDLSTRSNIVGYWSCEDAAGASFIAPGVGDKPLNIAPGVGSVSLAAYDGFVASAPLPTFAGARISGPVPVYTGNDDQRFMAVVHLPESGVPSTTGRSLLLARSTGTIKECQLLARDNGNLQFIVRDAVDTELYNSGFVAAGVNGKNILLWIWLHKNGTGTDWQFGWLVEGDSFGSVAAGTIASSTWTRWESISLGTVLDLGGTAIGHAAIMNGDVHAGFWDVATQSMVAWKGESAGNRIIRLSNESAVPMLVTGDPDISEQMGSQKQATLLDLFDECAQVDLGYLTERRDAEGMLYRTRWSLYNQVPALTLDMAAGAVANPFEPLLDDAAIVNDMTVSRVDGASYRKVLASGPLGTGSIVGRHDNSVELNIYSDSRLAHQASWRLFLGTTPGHRIAALEVELEQQTALQQAVLRLRQGDLIQLLNTPKGLPPGPIDLIVLGWSETITSHSWRITFNCALGLPFQVGVYGSTTKGRYSSDGSSLVSAFIAGTGTSMSVATPAGPLWTTVGSYYPLDIVTGGVVLRVTAVSGASSPQTFTVQQTPINGVVKTVPAGSVVALARPAVYAL